MASDEIIVEITFPGASSLEVEEGICRKLEESVRGVDGIKEITSTAAEDMGILHVEVADGKDPRIVLDRVRNKVTAISDFPKAAERPVIYHEVYTQPVLLLTLQADMDERGLKEWALRVRDDIRDLPGISQASLVGTRDYEIHVEVSRQNLERFGLSLPQVADAIRKSNLNLDAGTLKTDAQDIRVRAVGRRYTGAELASIIVLAGPGGEHLPLERIAAIRDGFTDHEFELGVDGKTTALVMVYKTRGQSELDISDKVQAYIKHLNAELPPGAHVSTLYDFSNSTRTRLRILISNGISGLLIVFGLLWLFTDIRLAFWAGMGIPVSLCGALGILWGTGGTLNMVSCMSMILVMGIIVDDAIVVGESIFTHRQKRGDAPGAALLAAVNGADEVAFPILAAVATTILAFFPLFFVKGVMGKYIEILPTVVVAALAVSLFECYFMLPAHMSHLPAPKSMSGKTGTAGSDANGPVSPFPWGLRHLHRLKKNFTNGMEYFIQKIYPPVLHWVLTWRYFTFCSCIALLFLTLGLVQGGFVKFEVFPPIDGFVVSSSVRFPDGTPAHVTKQALQQMDDALLRMNTTMKTASGEPMLVKRLHLLGQEAGGNDFMPSRGHVQALLIPPERRGIPTRSILAAWEREIGVIPGATNVSFTGQENEGDDDKPISVWVSGESMDSLIGAADIVAARLKKFKGVYQIGTDHMPGKQEFRLALKPEARTLGLSQEDMALQVHAALDGEEALRLQRGRDNIKIKVRYTEQERRQATSLENMRIRTDDGREIPLSVVADITSASGMSTIKRFNGKRRIAVSANIDPQRANAYEISRALEAFIPQVRQRYPDVSVSLQGEERKHREPFESLLYGFPMAILGIYVIIASIFRSYVQPFIIMFTIPLGIIGAILGHLIMGHNLSMFSVFGMVALSGVVVNDAIVLIECFNTRMSEGMPLHQAIVETGKRRFRAVFLTTASTVGGLVPLITETSLEAQSMIPMALSLAGGELFATVLTLLAIPALIHILNDIRMLAHNLLGSHPQSREALEPGTHRVLPFSQGSAPPIPNPLTRKPV